MADENKIKECVQTIPRPILGKIYKWKVARASIMKGEDPTTTSKIHTFKPMVEIPEAVGWLLRNKSIDGALIFENDACVTFADGKYAQYIDRP